MTGLWRLPFGLFWSHSVCRSSLSASPATSISEKIPCRAKWQPAQRSEIAEWRSREPFFVTVSLSVQQHTLLNHKLVSRSFFSSFPSSSTSKPLSCPSSSSPSSSTVNFTLEIKQIIQLNTTVTETLEKHCCFWSEWQLTSSSGLSSPALSLSAPPPPGPPHPSQTPGIFYLTRHPLPQTGGGRHLRRSGRLLPACPPWICQPAPDGGRRKRHTNVSENTSHWAHLGGLYLRVPPFACWWCWGRTWMCRHHLRWRHRVDPSLAPPSPSASSAPSAASSFSWGAQNSFAKSSSEFWLNNNSFQPESQQTYREK